MVPRAEPLKTSLKRSSLKLLTANKTRVNSPPPAKISINPIEMIRPLMETATMLSVSINQPTDSPILHPCLSEISCLNPFQFKIQITLLSRKFYKSTFRRKSSLKPMLCMLINLKININPHLSILITPSNRITNSIIITLLPNSNILLLNSNTLHLSSNPTIIVHPSSIKIIINMVTKAHLRSIIIIIIIPIWLVLEHIFD